MNQKNYYGQTALFNAVSEGSVQCTDMLLKAGADVNITDNWGRTALFEALKRSSVKCIDMLLKAGSDVNATDEYGHTVLHQTESYLRGIRKVLHEEVKVNVRNNHGFNVLTQFLKELEDPRCKTDNRTRKEFAMLYFAAGESVDETKVREVPDYLKPSAEISLMNICRETIRKHLLQMSDVNLFDRVPQLPLPRRMMSYLLYDVTLDLEEKDNKDE